MNKAVEFDPEAVLRLRRLGNADFVREMIDLAAKLATEKVSAARRALDAGDLQALADATHALKSSAAGVGALHMFELASRIELLSRRGEREPLPQLLAELEAAHTRVQPSLAAARKNVAP